MQLLYVTSAYDKPVCFINPAQIYYTSAVPKVEKQRLRMQKLFSDLPQVWVLNLKRVKQIYWAANLSNYTPKRHFPPVAVEFKLQD